MSRPSKPLLARVASLLAVSEQELQTLLDSWPTPTASQYQCLHGPVVIKHGRSTRRTISAIFELILDRPLHKSWRPTRLCGIETCRNPLHYELRTIHHVDGTVSEPLPMRCFQIDLAQQLAGEVEDDPEDVIDTLLAIEGGRDMTPDELHERTAGIYSPSQYAAALEAIHAEGL
ncbi:hypothetical protein GVN21_13080 [Caulobacter sp. SLTY]|uniref:hypothetical protein n=1 Tax=Caulobacter sp. SLTY TaxID=2683262 RepID=UPI001412ED1D|nr:hypothetical protein [Caulobacter sp. SLTY]NBB16293.1 hypothetical protein [Caulobacter sp. SLTY]